jgi:hypothetical protein
MINLSLLEDMMRHLGLPSALVADSLGGGSSTEHPASLKRIARRSPSLIRLGWAQLVAVARGSRNRQRIAAIDSTPAATFMFAKICCR